MLVLLAAAKSSRSTYRVNTAIAHDIGVSANRVLRPLALDGCILVANAKLTDNGAQEQPNPRRIHPPLIVHRGLETFHCVSHSRPFQTERGALGKGKRMRLTELINKVLSKACVARF
ncbi:MAG: hypothetical protein AB9869_18815 [Verrucomicrobiia bacterium]